MKAHPLRTAALLPVLLVASTAMARAQMLYIEHFERPAVVEGGFLEIPTGSYEFDNPGWVITNVAPVGVFIDNNYLFQDGQVLAFGGWQSPPGNRAETIISGFNGTTSPQISFDYFTMGFETQGIIVEVFDPYDSEALLYSATFISNGSVVDAPFLANPSGDSIRLRISQTGNTMNSDSAIDNIRIYAPIPEPTIPLLGSLGLMAALLRRRR